MYYTLAGGPQCRHRGSSSFEGFCCVYMISCAITCESIDILLFLSLRQSKGVLVVGWKIFFWMVLDLVVRSVLYMMIIFLHFMAICLVVIVGFCFSHFQMLQLFLSIHEQLCGSWG